MALYVCTTLCLRTLSEENYFSKKYEFYGKKLSKFSFIRINLWRLLYVYAPKSLGDFLH
jgi:hypothetical protein